MKRCKSLFFILLALVIGSCHKTGQTSSSLSTPSSIEVPTTSVSDKKKSKVHLYSVPEGVNTYNEAKLYVGEELCDMYLVKTNTEQVWSGENYKRVDNGVAIFALEGKVNIRLECDYQLTFDTKIRPLKYNINPIVDINKNILTFQIYDAGHYVIEPNNDKSKTIHIFVHSLLKQETIDLDDNNVIYFGPGLHTKDNNKYLSGDSEVNLKSNQIVYLDYGAVVRGRFTASNQENISIIGPGVVDGSTFERISGKSQFIPFDFQYCRNITFKDFTMLDTAGWTINWYFLTDSLIDNIHIISSRSNGDGVSLQSCQNIEVKNTFVRSWDDSLVVKNYPRWDNRNIHGVTKNIKFENCTLWTDLAQSMEVGYETVGTMMENITFNNITVLHNFHKPVMSIHNGNNANIKQVKFTNITVEDASMGQGDAGSSSELVDIHVKHSSTWSDQHTITALGSVDDVLVKNIVVKSGSAKLKFTFEGCVDTRNGYNNSKHMVKNITITDVNFKGKDVNRTFPNMTFYQNEHTENINLTLSGEKITGAEFIRYMSKEELKEYGEQYIVLKD